MGIMKIIIFSTKNGAEKQEYSNSISQGKRASLLVKSAHIIQHRNADVLIV
jgi:hypothetical protein